MGKDADNEVFVRDLQIQLQGRGYYSGAIDGHAGPMTRAGVRRVLPDFGAAPPPAGGSIANRLVQLAIGELGVRETSKNQGPGIGKYWGATTYPTGEANREPWCAAFVCWLVAAATKGMTVPFSLPRSPVAYDAEKWAAANKGKKVEVIADKAKIRPGDILVFNFSHIGIAERAASNGSVATIEGNTDAAGSRDGGGVYRKNRALSLVRSAIRITA